MTAETKDPAFHYRQAFLKRASGDLNGAILDLEKAVQSKDSQISYVWKLTELYCEGGQYEKAIERIDGLLSHDPGNQEYRKKKIEALRQLDRNYEAFEEFEKGNELNPHDPEWLMEEAEFLHDAEKPGEALDRIARAININPEKPEYRIAKADIMLELDNIHGALNEVNEAIRVMPCNPDNYVLAAKLMDELGMHEDAERHLLKATELRPHEIIRYQDLSEHFEKLENFRKAIECHDRMIELNPERAQLYFERAGLKEETGDVQGAREDYRKALSLEPRNPQYRKRLERLTGNP